MTPDVRRWHEAFLTIRSTPNPRPTITLIRLENEKLVTGFHWDRTFAWCYTTAQVNTVLNQHVIPHKETQANKLNTIIAKRPLQ
jgi:hypothetical protein